MKIVIADDEQLALDSVTEAVREAAPGAEIHTYKNPLKLLADVREMSCDVAFLDIKMRGISGIELGKELKLISPFVNIIFVTGYDEYMGDAFRMHASSYLLKPATAEAVKRELDNLRYPVESIPLHPIKIQTFGNFEVFYKGEPVRFLRSKSKEILAFLVDKQGTSVTPAEIACVLWEDCAFDRSHQKQLHNCISDLRKSLALVGAEDIIIKNRKGIMVDKNGFDCDLYRFLDGDPRAINAYTGQYMFAYSWAEITSSFLNKKTNK